jgi:hypothetical protein
MLGKRLVDYSDEESGQETAAQPTQQQQAADPEESSKPLKKKIAYSSLPNPFKSLLQAESISKIQEEAQLQTARGKQREISFDTVRGGRKLVLDAPREKVWKGSKKEREPFYYTAFKEIYKAEIDKSLQPEGQEREQQRPPAATAAETELVDGQAMQVRDISQEQLVQFDYEKYRELNDRKELLLEDKLQMLKRGSLDSNLDRLKTRAMELLEKEASAEVLGTKEEQGMKRNKKQYGF